MRWEFSLLLLCGLATLSQGSGKFRRGSKSLYDDLIDTFADDDETTPESPAPTEEVSTEAPATTEEPGLKCFKCVWGEDEDHAGGGGDNRYFYGYVNIKPSINALNVSGARICMIWEMARSNVNKMKFASCNTQVQTQDTSYRELYVIM